DVAYRGSQPWPFPASLMLGFAARALTTELRPDGVELNDARWFTRPGLAEAVRAGDVLMPGRASIARALVYDWVGGRLPDASRPPRTRAEPSRSHRAYEGRPGRTTVPGRARGRPGRPA